MASHRGRPASSWKGNEGGHYNLEGKWCPDPVIDCRTKVKRKGRNHNSSRSGRQPLPPIWGVLVYAMVGVGFWVGGVVILIAGHLIALILVALWSWLLCGVPGAHKAIVNRRNRERERNMDRVEDWIIRTDLPPSSPELAEREAELERLCEPRKPTVRNRFAEQTERHRAYQESLQRRKDRRKQLERIARLDRIARQGCDCCEGHGAACVQDAILTLDILAHKDV